MMEIVEDLYDCDIEMNESQDSTTTLGSWRQKDEPNSATRIQGKWEEYLEAGRVKDRRGFSVRL